MSVTISTLRHVQDVHGTSSISTSISATQSLSFPGIPTSISWPTAWARSAVCHMTELDMGSKKIWCSCWPWEVVILNPQRRNYAGLVSARESPTYEVPPPITKIPFQDSHSNDCRLCSRHKILLEHSTHGNGNVLGGWEWGQPSCHARLLAGDAGEQIA